MSVYLPGIPWLWIGQPAALFPSPVAATQRHLPPMYTSPTNHPMAKVGYACAHLVACAIAEPLVVPHLVLESDAAPTRWFLHGLPPWPKALQGLTPDLVYLGYGMLKGTQYCARIDNGFWWQPLRRPTDDAATGCNNVSGCFAMLEMTRAGVQLVERMAMISIRRGLIIDQCLPYALTDEVVLVAGKPLFCQGPESNHNFAVTNIPLQKD